jgi:hypothetical protein
MLTLAEKIPLCFFPRDDTRKLVSFHCDEIAQALTIEFPRRVQVVIPRIIKVSFTFKIDGHSLSCKSPLI